MLVLAHAAPGFDAVGLSPGLVLYLTAAGVALATLALRARPVAADPVDDEDRWPGDELPRRRAGRAGRPRGRRPRGHARLRVVRQRPPRRQPGHRRGLQPVLDRRPAAQRGRWATCGGWSTRSTTSPGSCRGGRAPRTGPDLWWLPALLLATFGWTWLAWPDGLRPRSIGWWLAGVHRGHGPRRAGRRPGLGPPARGVRRGLRAARPREPDRLDRPAAPPAQPADVARVPEARPASRARCSRSLVGMALFDAVSYTQWWADLLGVRSLGGYTAFNTLGLAWLVATAAIVWIAVARVAGVGGGRADRASDCGWPRRSPRWPPGTPRRTRSGRC